VALFSSQHPIAIRQNGAFIFTLYAQGTVGTPGAASIGTWRVETDGPQRTLASTFAGPSYLFQLNLMDVGGDKLPLDRADLVCRFEPADGSPPVHSDGVRTIQIGRRLAASSSP
jgi:hypothetical protein